MILPQLSTSLPRRLSRLPFHCARASLSSKPLSDGDSAGRLFPEEINILYDSKCNVCRWEMEWLRRRDREIVNASEPKIRLTDLEDPSFDPLDPANGGINYVKGMSSMTAVTADGKVIEGVPVFRLAYQQVGLGWLFAITQWPFLNVLFDASYKVFARYRTIFTRGRQLESLIEAYEQKKELELQQHDSDCESCRRT
jgi:predicted DCC family thiol-disulfide oxidoreductase YuxK